ncbi:MAG TPA: polyprenol monophosphomannose synthase [Mycobacteriales bacterium]|jgi:dolichol-phosphate mannosyltransferase|nr:polyprenol monophosphomannose synthase [Mycobacteriales bacterium]
MPAVVVVMPTYNERDNIEAIVGEVLARPCTPHLLVVDDSSPDGTGGLVEKLAAGQPDRVSLLTRAGKSGLGRAYAAGFAHALAELDPAVVVQMDADGSHLPVDIDRLVAETSDADLVIGSRYVVGGSVSGWSVHRQAISRAGNIYARTVLGSPIRDLTGGFKAWRAELLARLDAATTASDGYAFQIEMTMRARAAGARIVEVPIVFHERVAGTSKMSTKIAIEALRGVPAMRRRY